jgi:hypothetical protein
MDELAQFLETHDLDEYWDALSRADSEPEPQERAYLVPVDEGVMNRIALIAKMRRVSPETLINAWLNEKIAEVD